MRFRSWNRSSSRCGGFASGHDDSPRRGDGDGQDATGWSHSSALPAAQETVPGHQLRGVSAGLIESEMFGHVRGAYTGADADRVGKFAAVGRGTLFLDEIDSLPLTVQSKLLRAIEERAFEPVGSNRTETMHARLVAASNRPLEAEVAAGRFRADLFYRLNVANFVLPPLRQGLDAIPALVREFLDEYAAKSQRRIVGITPEALRSLLTHTWPGNIRELRNVIEAPWPYATMKWSGSTTFPLPSSASPSRTAVLRRHPSRWVPAPAPVSVSFPKP